MRAWCTALRLLTLLGLCAPLGACTPSPSCPSGTTLAAGRCEQADAAPHDASISDAGTDAPDAHLPCGGACTGSTPHCDAATDSCVQCLAPSDCPSASAPVCSASHTCSPCTASADCTRFSGTGVCDGASGACVECTALDESACAGNVCDAAAHTCTSVPAGSVGICLPCTSDRACIAGAACVTERFDTSLGGGTLVDVGAFCLPAGASCPLAGAPFVSAASLPNRAGTPTAVCDLTLTTCPAYLDYRTTTCTTDTDCGASTLDDGLCRTRSGVGMQCTTRCVGPEDCTAGIGCSTGLAPHYCCFGASCT